MSRPTSKTVAARAGIAAAVAPNEMRRTLAGSSSPNNNTPASNTPAALTDPVAGRMIPDGCDLILTGDFLTESRELLESAESALLNLESDPDDVEAINTVFRAFHTIKGTSAYLGLAVVATFSHNAESLLTRMRDRTIRCAGGYASLALQSVDVLSDLLRRVQLEMEGTPPLSPPDLAPLEARLAHPETFGISDQERRVAWRVLADHKQEATPGPTRGSHRVDGSVRVGTDRLDRLIEMAGELVIAQSLLAQDDALENSADPSLARKLAHSTKIVRELHTLTMSLRMIPLRSTLQKLKRLARDVAHRTGKLVTFDCVGEDTEVDKALVEMISDPLMHLLRNAIDHGIETPPERAAAGKDAAGHIAVHAYQTGGSVVVELTDDGRGLDRSRIVRKAEQMGLISADRQLTDTEVWPLILAPGFSTAEQVTEFSGRGVGLDVVKRSIGSMHGSVDIESTAGQGSRFTIRVPLTLAITDAMLSRVAHERYIIPTVHIRFSFRPALGALRTVVGRGEVVLLREEVLPIVRLHRVFGVDGAVENPDDAILIVVSDGTTRAALMVDELLGQHQVVAKSLGRGLPSTPGISGGAILGDARVGLIIDVHAILAALRAGARPVRAVA